MNSTRRGLLHGFSGALAGVAGWSLLGRSARAAEPLKGNINHSVCRGAYRSIPMEQFCDECRRIGIKSVELTGPDDWPTLKQYGLTCAMGSGVGSIAKGFNRIENHDELVAGLEKRIPEAAEAGVPSVICMSGNRDGLDDEEGLQNCLVGLKRIMPLCEKKGVNLVMELLNSKVNHPDYMCDNTKWGFKLCRALGSDRFKLLYDIYHMQIMEGDIIRTIQDGVDCIGHYHTGGNPGRHEIDDTQEIYYPAVMRAIVATGYKGYVGQEFSPTWPDKIKALETCVRICDV